ncbi:MAG: hypothetical protein V7609_386 [Verrucomicrobiota bacterium]
MRALALLFLFSVAGSGLVRAEITEVDVIADPAVYGDYPKNYQEIVTNWLATKLVDAPSAQIEWVSPPKPAALPDKSGKRIFGYMVEFKVNSRNRFGAYTGMQRHGALIRDGNVIKGTGFGF